MRRQGQGVRSPAAVRKLAKALWIPAGAAAQEQVTVRSISERQRFHIPVAIRKLAVTKFYPFLLKLRNSSGASAFVKQSSLFIQRKIYG